MSVSVKNGTPLHVPALCETCVHAHIERGYGENELTIFCQDTWPEHRIQFRVRACSKYLEKRWQSLKQMEEIAWVLCRAMGSESRVLCVPTIGIRTSKSRSSCRFRDFGEFRRWRR